MKSKNLLGVVLATTALALAGSTASARQAGEPLSWTRDDVPPLETVRMLRLPEVDVDTLLQQHAPSPRDPAPLRIAVPNDVWLDTGEHGTWHHLPAGARLWRLRVHAPQATDLNFGFDRYTLPAGATLHVYSEVESYYEGPYDDQDNEEHGELWTPPVPGDRAVIELYVPPGVEFEPVLRLKRVSAGFRDFFGRQPRAGDQGSCNIDVVCPEGDDWRPQIRAVAAYSLSGVDACTGQLINNTVQDFTPYLYTADHCEIDESNDQTMVVFWNYESPNCGDNGGGSRKDNQTGAIFRAARTDVDVALVELEEEPPAEFDVFYGGWDRTDIAPVGGVGIHHPSVREKSISFNEDLLTTVDNCIGGGGIDSHWQVDDWELGTTEPGSSGSGLWNPDNKLLMGHLSGGDASCSNPAGSDCYGKLSVAWYGPSPASRLKDWLDPLSAGVETLESLDPSRPCPSWGPVALAVDSKGNQVFEPGEEVDVAPTWRNVCSAAQDLEGTATDFSGPPGADYTITNNAAQYGEVASRDTASCLDIDNCYGLGVDDPPARPATHWDAAFDEELSDGTTQTWTLHIGDSFADVPRSNPFYTGIETLLHSGVTGGCGDGDAYCPGDAVSRSQMPVFMLRALMGLDYTPVPCVEDDEPFDDVAFDSLFCPWIQDLADRGIVSGCGGANYCPGDAVTRAQMAIFLLRTLEGPDYTPIKCSERFDDVPCTSLFADWIEDLAAREVTGGCSENEYCPGNPVTRAQMAVFVTRTFGLSLYGP